MRSSQSVTALFAQKTDKNKKAQFEVVTSSLCAESKARSGQSNYVPMRAVKRVYLYDCFAAGSSDKRRGISSASTLVTLQLAPEKGKNYLPYLEAVILHATKRL